jgi:hypothetical protein
MECGQLYGFIVKIKISCAILRFVAVESRQGLPLARAGSAHFGRSYGSVAVATGITEANPGDGTEGVTVDAEAQK